MKAFFYILLSILKVSRNAKDSNVKMSIRHIYAPGNKPKDN